MFKHLIVFLFPIVASAKMPPAFYIVQEPSTGPSIQDQIKELKSELIGLSQNLAEALKSIQTAQAWQNQVLDQGRRDRETLEKSDKCVARCVAKLGDWVKDEPEAIARDRQDCFKACADKYSVPGHC